MIGVCIKYFHENYGGMLQAFATVSLLKERDINFELLRYKKKHNVLSIIRNVPRLFNIVLLNDKYEAILKYLGKKKHPDFIKNDQIRMKAFKSFRKLSFDHLTKEIVGYRELCNRARIYTAVITGSDQLWSPAGLPTNFYNLKFVPDKVRKISYASSFGVRYIPWYQMERTKEFLNRFECISMRENRGSEIVEELTGKPVPTILDPVFMFDKDGWENLIPFRKILNDSYIFAYFLGDNIEHRKAVEAAAMELNCKIVVLRHLDQYVEYDEKFGDFAPYDVSPADFLNLIRGASYVCTDSYHGSCFSIIHNKQFVVFDRYSDASKNSKNSRIDSLCTNLGVKDRRYKSLKHVSSQLTQKIDYEAIRQNIESLRCSAVEYIDKALDGLCEEEYDIN